MCYCVTMLQVTVLLYYCVTVFLCYCAIVFSFLLFSVLMYYNLWSYCVIVLLFTVLLCFCLTMLVSCDFVLLRGHGQCRF